MNIAEALEKIKSVDGGADLVSTIEAHTKELRDEAAKYRTRVTPLETELGSIKAERDKALQDLDAARKGGNGKGGNEALEARLARLEQDLATSESKRKEAEGTARQTKAQTLLREALAKHKAIRPDDLVDIHLGKVKFKDDGSPYFTDASGAERSVEEHVQNWLKDKPEWVSSSQQRGPGGGGAKPPHKAEDLTKIPPTERMQMAFAGNKE